MPTQQFRKKPVKVEALHYTGLNPIEALLFCPTATYAVGEGLWIKTLEGIMHISPGDYIIRGTAGEFYPCKPDIFEQTYEPVEE